MYPGITNPYARYALAFIDILAGTALAALATFSIVYWGRATYRVLTNRDWFTGAKVKSVIIGKAA